MFDSRRNRGDNRPLSIPFVLIPFIFWSTLMNTKTFGFATLLCAIAYPPHLPRRLSLPFQAAFKRAIGSGTFDITPDLSLVPDNSGTPIAVEFGFRLTGAQLLSATIADPVAFDTPNPGKNLWLGDVRSISW